MCPNGELRLEMGTMQRRRQVHIAEAYTCGTSCDWNRVTRQFCDGEDATVSTPFAASAIHLLGAGAHACSSMSWSRSQRHFARPRRHSRTRIQPNTDVESGIRDVQAAGTYDDKRRRAGRTV
jgi:hypothetical protein